MIKTAKSTYCQRGTTLIEVLLFIVIMAIMVGVLSAFAFFLLESRTRAHVVLEVEEQSSYVMQTLGGILRTSSAIIGPTQGSSGNTLTLTRVDGAFSPTVIDLDSGRIRLNENGNSFYLTSSEITVTNLSFENIGEASAPTSSVRIFFDVEYTSQSERGEYIYTESFQTSVTLRDN